MLRLANVATPFTACAVVVPESVPPAGFVPIATVTLPAKLVTGLPNTSSAVTCTAGVIGDPAVVVPGCTVKTSRVAATATTKSVSDSALPPNGTHPLARPVWSTARACQ